MGKHAIYILGLAMFLSMYVFVVDMGEIGENWKSIVGSVGLSKSILFLYICKTLL